MINKCIGTNINGDIMKIIGNRTVKTKLALVAIDFPEQMKSMSGKFYRKYHFVDIDLNPGKPYHTFVSDGFKNKKHWAKIETLWETGFLPVVEGVFHLTTNDKINADSNKFSVLCKMDLKSDETRMFCVELWKKVTNGKPIPRKQMLSVPLSSLFEEA